MTSALLLPIATLSPSLTSTSMAGMLRASTFGPTMMQPVKAFRRLLPAVWSPWWWVMRMWVSVQPFS